MKRLTTVEKNSKPCGAVSLWGTHFNKGVFPCSGGESPSTAQIELHRGELII